MEEVKKEEPKKPRNIRRLEIRKKEILDKLVLRFFKLRSKYGDPEGDLVATLYDVANKEWIKECKNFNSRRNPFKLRYEAFTESVDFYLKREKEQMRKNEEANKEIGFNHWYRRTKLWREYPFRRIWFYVISGFSRKRGLDLWIKYYKSNVVKHGTN